MNSLIRRPPSIVDEPEEAFRVHNMQPGKTNLDHFEYVTAGSLSVQNPVPGFFHGLNRYTSSTIVRSTAFVFAWRMPMAVNESAPSPPPNPLSDEANAALETGSSQALEVWLVEDDPGDVFIVKEVLKQAGLHFAIHVCADGEEALSFLKRLDADQSATCPALILLDLNLPRVSGAELLMSVRQHPRCNSVPVIVLTSSDSPLDLAAIEQGGASGYFRKPRNLTAYLELGNMIRQVLPAAGKHQ